MEVCSLASPLVQKYYNQSEIDISAYLDPENGTAASIFDPGCMRAFMNGYKSRVAMLSAPEIVIFSILYVLISVLGVVGNGLVIFVILRTRRMRVNRNVYILNLALSNFVLAVIVVPFLWLPSREFRFPYGEGMCKFSNAFPGVNIYCSTLTITVMSIDRYYKARDTSRMNRIQHFDRSRENIIALVTAAAVWVFAFCISAPLLVFFESTWYPGREFYDVPLFPDGRRMNFAWKLCILAESYPAPQKTKIFLFISLLQIAFLYIIPLGVLLFFNLRLIRFLARNTLQRFASKLSSNRSENRAVPAALLASVSRRNRTTFLLMSMAGSYAILWFPYTIYTLLTDIQAVTLNYTFMNIVRMLSMVSICVNPFLYGYLNSNFKREFQLILASSPLTCSFAQMSPQISIGNDPETRPPRNIGGARKSVPTVEFTLQTSTPTSAPKLRKANSLRIPRPLLHGSVQQQTTGRATFLRVPKQPIQDEEYSSVYIPDTVQGETE